MQKIIALFLSLGCFGCAGINYAAQQYSGVRVEEVAMPDDTYRIFDKPAENRMMVTSSLAAAMGQGLGAGLLLNAIDNTPPKPRFDAAALQYLENTGRPGCRVVDLYLLVKPQFEVKYDCAPQASAAPFPGGRRSPTR